MKTTLSFWQVVNRRWSWLRRWLRIIWRAERFNRSPTEKNLLISFWYDYQFDRGFRPKETVYDFLDNRVQSLEGKIADPERSVIKRKLEVFFLKALHKEHIRLMVVDFLESPSPEENYEPVMEAMRKAWRIKEVGVGPGEKLAVREVDGEEVLVEAKVLEEKVLGEGSREEGILKEEDLEGKEALREEEDAKEQRPVLWAKTYVIAADLDFELSGKGEDFQVLSRNLPDLKQYIKDRFGVDKLPGRFADFKGFSYKKVLIRNDAKKGQLKPNFRQIIDNPDVFGEAIVARARKILSERY